MRSLSVIWTVLKITSLIWSAVHSSPGSWPLFNTRGVCSLSGRRDTPFCFSRVDAISKGERERIRERKREREKSKGRRVRVSVREERKKKTRAGQRRESSRQMDKQTD